MQIKRTDLAKRCSGSRRRLPCQLGKMLSVFWCEQWMNPAQHSLLVALSHDTPCSNFCWTCLSGFGFFEWR